MEIIHIVRDGRSLGGVSNVVRALNLSMAEQDVDSRIVDRHSFRSLEVISRVTGRLPQRLRLLIEVVSFTIVSSLAYRTRPNNVVAISHNDCLTGDIYVNHGVHRALIFPKDRRGQWGKLAMSPIHIFLLTREFVRFRFRMNRYIVNFSKRGQEELAAYWPVAHAKLAVIPNGVDTEHFKPDRSHVAPHRAILGVPPDGLLVAFVGNEFERKGLDLVIEAVESLEDTHLVVAGGSEAMMRRVKRRLGRERLTSVSFLGKLDDPRLVYQAADVLALPSAQEASPLVVLEAMACGLPCVVSDTGSIADIVIDGVNGLIVERSVGAIITALRKLQAQAYIQELSAHAADDARRFDWQTIAVEYVHLAQEAADNRHGHDRKLFGQWTPNRRS